MAFELNRKTLLTLFLAFLMFGSLFFTFLIAGPQTTQQIQPPPITPSEPPTSIPYTATGVPAKVERLFPAIIVTATTTEADISKLDFEIKKINGILAIQQSYFVDPNQGKFGGESISSLTYVAQATVAPNADLQSISDSVLQNPIFSGPQVLQAGMVSLPPSVVFSNTDLNLTLDHKFLSPLANAFLSPQSKVGDEVKVYLQAGISGSSALSLQAIEEENITAAPTQLFLSSPFTVSSLGTTLYSTFEYTPGLLDNQDALKNDLLSNIEGAQSAEVSAGFFFPVLEITLDKNYSVFEQDFTTMLSDINGVQGQIFNLDQNKMTVFLDSLTFSQVKQKILSELSALNFGVLEAKDPTSQAEATLVFSKSELSTSAEGLSSFLSGKNFSNVQVLQGAIFDQNSFFDLDTNKAYPFDQNTFEAQVKPTHKVGDLVELEINLTISRGKITTVNAKEKTA